MQRTYTASELARLASDLLHDEGLTQAHVADRLGISVPAVSLALSDPGSRIGTVIRILEVVGGYDVSACWRVEVPEAAA